MAQDRTIKYTSDGRKVLVVGKLNAEQTIVQEIFISNGAEIPSGENFIVTSLHDAPAESWKEKKLRELEERYERERSQLEAEIKDQRRRLAEAAEKARLRASTLFQFAEGADDKQLERLHWFLAGEITHFFVARSYDPAIITWEDDDVFQVDRWGGGVRLEGVKLVSLVGQSNGNLSYRLNDYKDGSGSSVEIIPFCSYDEALQEAQRRLDALAAKYVEFDDARGNLNFSKWEKIEGIVIPDAALKKHERQKESARKKRVAKLREELRELGEPHDRRRA